MAWGTAWRPTPPVSDAASRIFLSLVPSPTEYYLLLPQRTRGPARLECFVPTDRSIEAASVRTGSLSTLGMVDRTESGVTVQKKKRGCAALKARRFGRHQFDLSAECAPPRRAAANAVKLVHRKRTESEGTFLGSPRGRARMRISTSGCVTKPRPYSRSLSEPPTHRPRLVTYSAPSLAD